MKPKYLFTPGPWLTDETDDTIFVATFANSTSESYVCQIEKSTFDGETVENATANARAIAAVPELIEALQWLVEFCGLHEHDKNDPAIAKVYAALAKATGGDQ